MAARTSSSKILYSLSMDSFVDFAIALGTTKKALNYRRQRADMRVTELTDMALTLSLGLPARFCNSS